MTEGENDEEDPAVRRARWPPLFALRAADPKPELLVFGAASLTESLQDLGKAYEAKTGHEGRLLLRRLERPRAPDPGRRAGGRVLLGRHGEDGRAREGGPRHGGRPARVPLEQPRGRRARRLEASRSPTPRTSSNLPKIAIADPAAVPVGVYAKKWLTGLGLWEKIEPKVVPTLDVRAVARGRRERRRPGRGRLQHRRRDREVRARRLRGHERARDPLLGRARRRLEEPDGRRRRSWPSWRGPKAARSSRSAASSSATRSSGDRRRLLDPAADAARGGDRHAR